MKEKKLIAFFDQSEVGSFYYNSLIGIKKAFKTVSIIQIGGQAVQSFKGNCYFITIDIPYSVNSLQELDVLGQERFAKRLIDILIMDLIVQDESDENYLFSFNLGYHFSLINVVKNHLKGQIIIRVNNLLFGKLCDEHYAEDNNLVKCSLEPYQKAVDGSDLILTSSSQTLKKFETLFRCKKKKVYVFQDGSMLSAKEAEIYISGQGIDLREKYRFGISERIILYIGDELDNLGPFLGSVIYKIKTDSSVRAIIWGKYNLEHLADAMKSYWSSFIITGRTSDETLKELIQISDLVVSLPANSEVKYNILDAVLYNKPLITQLDYDFSKRNSLEGERPVINFPSGKKIKDKFLIEKINECLEDRFGPYRPDQSTAVAFENKLAELLNFLSKL